MVYMHAKCPLRAVRIHGCPSTAQAPPDSAGGTCAVPWQERLAGLNAGTPDRGQLV
jgi:hypothetical protein